MAKKSTKKSAAKGSTAASPSRRSGERGKAKADKKSILTPASMAFMERYLNNASPTGFESAGQKLWLAYIKPYIHSHFVDNYGTVVGALAHG